MRLPIALITPLICSLGLSGFIHATPQPQVEFTKGAGSTWDLDWEGVSGRTYFVQCSVDLQTWVYAPIIEFGANPSTYGMDVQGAPKTFVRLSYVDDPSVTSISDAENADFDKDGLTNYEEVVTHQSDPNEWDSDGDGISDGGEVDGGTDPNDPADTPPEEWFILTGNKPENQVLSKKRTVTIPAGQKMLVLVGIASDEYPYYTDPATQNEFNDTLTWHITAENYSNLTYTLNVNSRDTQWDEALAEGYQLNGHSPVHLEDCKFYEAPPDADLEVEIELQATNIGDGTLPSTVMVGFLPVEVVELAPKLTDFSTGLEIDGSEIPNLEDGRTNPMVELNPVADRIAHREVKIRIGRSDVLSGKEITWSMEPLFVHPNGTNPIFRGDWANSATHADRFETSTEYEAYSFTRVSQEEATTEIDAEGYSAIRANLPPVGFNQARINIDIAGLTLVVNASETDIIDMEVPAIVVIDPGHGGTTSLPGSSWNNATSPTDILEKDMALEYGETLMTSLVNHATQNNAHIRVQLTRDEDINISGEARANTARDLGADVIYIIHFNAFDGVARGSLEVRRTSNNVNSQQDIDFIDRVLDEFVPALQAFDAAANKRNHVVVNTVVSSDTNLGNTAAYSPLRAGYCEVEFIDNPDVDQLLNHGANAAQIRTNISNAVRDAIIEDIQHQPAP